MTRVSSNLTSSGSNSNATEFTAYLSPTRLERLVSAVAHRGWQKRRADEGAEESGTVEMNIDFGG